GTAPLDGAVCAGVARPTTPGAPANAASVNIQKVVVLMSDSCVCRRTDRPGRSLPQGCTGHPTGKRFSLRDARWHPVRAASTPGDHLSGIHCSRHHTRGDAKGAAHPDAPRLLPTPWSRSTHLRREGEVK